MFRIGCTNAAVGILLVMLAAPGAGADRPPGGGTAVVPVNSQRSLTEIVGGDFDDATWTDPEGLIPEEIPGLTMLVNNNAGTKAGWRSPHYYLDSTRLSHVSLSCYRQRTKPAAAPGKRRTPFGRLTEPDYKYQTIEFHELKSAFAAQDDCAAFAFRDDDLLFKIEITGGSQKSRRTLLRSTAEEIWKFRTAQKSTKRTK